MMAVLGALLIWGAGWWLNIRLANGAHSDNPLVRVLIPAIFGITVILIWEILVAEFDVNPVILPAPSSIGARLLVEGPRLWADFQQTIIKGAMTGYIFGGLAAFGVAILADRSDFLTRGILPVGGFMAALPIVGTAPIFVIGSPKRLSWP
jgi:NitT/TauT family transport system permease protein